MNWYIGQEVVYIGNPNAAYEKDEIGKITSIKKGCSHYPVQINTENKIVPPFHAVRCDACGVIYEKPGDLLFFVDSVFVPVSNITELVESLQEEPETA